LSFTLPTLSFTLPTLSFTLPTLSFTLQILFGTLQILFGTLQILFGTFTPPSFTLRILFGTFRTIPKFLLHFKISTTPLICTATRSRSCEFDSPVVSGASLVVAHIRISDRAISA
jgi:hypothetical protein